MSADHLSLFITRYRREMATHPGPAFALGRENLAPLKKRERHSGKSRREIGRFTNGHLDDPKKYTRALNLKKHLACSATLSAPTPIVHDEDGC